MSELEAQLAVRQAARAFEESLPPDQRKRLGQFFTGLPLGKLLAHLALSSNTHSALDPMAGHGDLLDALWQAASENGVPLARLDGVEIDTGTAQTCRERLDTIIGERPPARTIVTGTVFDERKLRDLSSEPYDLVITNPPYVRYQGRSAGGTSTAAIRSALVSAIESRAAAPESAIWKALADGYSGLADLSVPSWILAGLLVRPGGRLALVAPATWRSRDYADVVRYLLLRCFALEVVVEDTQPGWFSDALVRTHLIVARRLTDDAAAVPLHARECWPSGTWARVAPDAADERSLVGAAFTDACPEAQFASWLHDAPPEAVTGIELAPFDIAGEWAAVETRARRHRWYKELEAGGHDLPLFSSRPSFVATFLPPPLKAILPAGAEPDQLVTLEEAGIQVGQGLRTGCNPFFYVDVCGPAQAGAVPVRAAAALGGAEFSAPADALRPVIRRQAEAHAALPDTVPRGRVLDLRGWVLPEDEPAVRAARLSYKATAQPIPQTMTDELAAFVRRAAATTIRGSNRLIPELTAVRTNARASGRRGRTPRFWYMLPGFMPRHLPAVFIARIIHQNPWAECNADPPVLIDANFSTLWPAGEGWDRYSLKALLNSVWCRTFMEILGTPLGGGALKLEATHLRQIVVPRLSRNEQRALAAAGERLTRKTPDVQTKIDEIVLRAVVSRAESDAAVPAMAETMASHARMMRGARQKAAS